jgi:DNA polymerase-3 subunit delta
LTDAHVHLLRGDDAFAISLQVKSIIASLGADFDSSMNYSRLDGKSVSLEDMRLAVSTLPFFGGRRLVVIDDAISKVEKSRVPAFTAMLASAPPTTTLVIIVEDTQKWRKVENEWTRVWETLTPAHWLVQWCSSHPQACIVDLGLPDAKNMDAWILNETKRQEGKMEPSAAYELTRLTGIEDVLELVSDEGSVDVFAMLDSLMEGKTRNAQAMMRRLLDDTPPEVVLGALAHRLRQLILLAEAMDSGEDARSLARKTGIFINKIESSRNAVRCIGISGLEELYHHLLEIDLQAKTSGTDLATNLELLVLKTGHYFKK